MNYPRIYERVYCQPLCVTRERFLAIHGVLYPRLRAGFALEQISAIESPAKNRPTSSPYSGKRQQRVGPKINYLTGGIDDPRFYTMPAKGVAVIPIYGVLAKNLSSFEESCGGGTDITPIAYALAQAINDADVTAIILDIDSPGGEVTGIGEIAETIAHSPKPIFGFTDASACSAAYWIMSACDLVFCTRTSSVGSIGTYLAWLDETVALQLAGLRLELFAAGEHKGMGLPGRPLTEADRELLQSRVLEVNGWFTSAVMANRPEVGARMGDNTMEGQSFSGSEALSRGLVDNVISGFDELVALVYESLPMPPI